MVGQQRSERSTHYSGDIEVGSSHKWPHALDLSSDEIISSNLPLATPKSPPPTPQLRLIISPPT